jgi:hypothetical protein
MGKYDFNPNRITEHRFEQLSITPKPYIQHGNKLNFYNEAGGGQKKDFTHPT